MKAQSGDLGKASGNCRTPLSTALALAVSLALVCPGAMAGDPIPGVDVKLGKNPGGSVVALPIDEFGHFSLRLTEPGNYTLSTACKQPCIPHGISATYSGDANFGGSSGGTGSGPAPIIAILVGLLLPAVQDSANTPVAASFNVDKRGLVVSGQLPSTEGTYFIGTANGGTWKTLAEIKLQDFGILRGQISRSAGIFVAAGDINGDGRAETIVTPYSTGGHGDSRSAQVDMFLQLKAPAPANANAKPAATPGAFGEPVTFTANVAPLSPGAGTPTGSVTFHNAEGLRISENQSPRPTNRTITVTPVNDAPGISDQGAAGNLTTYGTAPGPNTGGDGKAPEIRGRLINNSETDPGVSGNAAGSNRDHIDQDAQIDIRRRAAASLSDADAEYLKIKLQEVLVSSTAKPSQSGNGTFPGKAGDPIQGIPVGLEGDPEPIKFNATTDAKGDFQFAKLPAGNYLLMLPGVQRLPITVGADGLAGGNVLKGLEGSLQLHVRKAGEKPIEYVLRREGPVNGIGGTGGGRLAAGGPIDGVNVAGSNRDHIDQDAQMDIRSPAAGPRLEPVGASLKNLEVVLASDTGGHKFSTRTDEKGAFNFTKLPVGKYTIVTSGATPKPGRLLTIGADGTFSGNLARSAGGEIDIISWSFATINSSGATLAVETVKPNAVKNPVSGFGSGNTPGFGGGFGAGPGAGMLPGGGMSPGNPMGPAGPMGGAGGPGGPMGGGAMRR